MIGDTDSIQAATDRLRRMGTPTDMTPFLVLLDCIADSGVTASGGSPCVMMFTPLKGDNNPPYCERHILRYGNTVLGVPITAPGGGTLPFRNVRYEIMPDGSIRELGNSARVTRIE